MEFSHGALRYAGLRYLQSISQPLYLFLGRSYTSFCPAFSGGCHDGDNRRRIGYSQRNPSSEIAGCDFSVWGDRSTDYLHSAVLYLGRIGHRAFHCLGGSVADGASVLLFVPPLSCLLRHLVFAHRLGVAFILAGILGSGAEFAVRSYLSYTSGLDMVGFYNTGFMMTMTYAGMVFQAMETDYFPRLSAVEGTGSELNSVVNRQIEVSLLLVSPLLSVFILASPLILHVLFSAKFLPVVGMMKIALMAMYFRAITLPIEYITLSKGDSKSYLFLEALYDVLLIALVILGFRLWSLEGTGIALFLLGIINLVVVLCFMRYRYHYRPSRQVLVYFAVQMLLGIFTYWASCLENPVMSWGIGGLACLVSLAFSLQVLHSKTKLWNSLVLKVKSKLKKK